VVKEVRMAWIPPDDICKIRREAMKHVRGFTLIELLVAILIIGLLLALLMPAVASSREATRRVQCANHLKQLALAALNYESVHNAFPYGVGGGAPPGPGRVPRWSAHYERT
jgi:prepilin-type N-terminal cleavage/methylation domain-containing protein